MTLQFKKVFVWLVAAVWVAGVCVSGSCWILFKAIHIHAQNFLEGKPV